MQVEPEGEPRQENMMVMVSVKGELAVRLGNSPVQSPRVIWYGWQPSSPQTNMRSGFVWKNPSAGESLVNPQQKPDHNSAIQLLIEPIGSCGVIGQ